MEYCLNIEYFKKILQGGTFFNFEYFEKILQGGIRQNPLVHARWRQYPQGSNRIPKRKEWDGSV